MMYARLNCGCLLPVPEPYRGNEIYEIPARHTALIPSLKNGGLPDPQNITYHKIAVRRVTDNLYEQCSEAPADHIPHETIELGQERARLSDHQLYLRDEAYANLLYPYGTIPKCWMQPRIWDHK